MATDSSRPAYADPAPDDLRDELIDASLINGKLVRDLEKAREENARLQQQLKTVGEECEHLNASTTHTQAELKTFQTERQQFKAELSALRQKFAAAEETLAAREIELTEARAKADAGTPEAEIEALESKLNEARKLAAEREEKAAATQVDHEAAIRRGDEWKAKAEAAEAALKQAQKASAKLDSKAKGLDQSLAAEKAQREQLAVELEEKGQELGQTQTRYAAIDDELHKTRWRLGEIEAALAGAQETGLRLATERVDLLRQLDEARAELAEAGDLKALLARTGDEIRDRSEKLRLAEEANESLNIRCVQLQRERDGFHRDLAESHTGREIVELRSRLDDAEAERARTAVRLSAIEADLGTVTATEAAARVELEQVRTERDAAVARAEALRETQAAMDNQVLRGIVARLNTDLGQRSAEIVRLKRGRFGLKTAYVLFAIGFLAVIAFALKVLPHALR